MSEVTAGAAPVAGTGEPHDVCVIGSGPAGAFVAHELVAAGARVILVEGGEGVTPRPLTPLPLSPFQHRRTRGGRQTPHYPGGLGGEGRLPTETNSGGR